MPLLYWHDGGKKGMLSQHFVIGRHVLPPLTTTKVSCGLLDVLIACMCSVCAVCDALLV